MNEHPVYPPRNLGLDLVRSTEAAALAAGRWLGRGLRDDADRAANEAMVEALNTLDMKGRMALGERHFDDDSPLGAYHEVGTGLGPEMDLVVDPIDGRNLLAEARSGALAVVSMAPRGSLWAPRPAIYMEKLVVDSDVAPGLVVDCLDAPVAWTLALIAQMKGKSPQDLMVFILDRPRHAEWIAEIRAAGARVMLRQDGDVAGALVAASRERNVDLMIGIGGVTEGVMTACAVKAMGGAMLGRLAPQSNAEMEAVKAAGLDTRQILTADDLVRSNEIFFAITGITDGPILKGVRFEQGRAKTQSLVVRGETNTRRTIFAEHQVN